MILDLLDIGFHAVVVFGLGKDFLFKSNPGRCVISNTKYKVFAFQQILAWYFLS